MGNGQQQRSMGMGIFLVVIGITLVFASNTIMQLGTGVVSIVSQVAAMKWAIVILCIGAFSAILGGSVLWSSLDKREK